jgi:hypothetical protein
MAAKKILKVKEKPDLVRDSFSKALLNVDRNGFAQYKTRKKSLRDKDAKIASLQQEIAEIKKQQSEMLALIKSINN